MCFFLFPAPWNPPARAAEAGEPVRVACVGDSITYGFTSSNAALHSYPSQLQNLLGDGYIIQMKTGKGKYKKIAAKKGKATSYTKKKLKRNTVYRFRIRSYKQNGSSKVYSAWSKPVKLRL